MIKKILLGSVFIVTCLFTSITYAENVKLHWNANTETDLSGYTIHYGVLSGTYTTTLPVGNVVEHTMSLNAGVYYIVVSAEDMSGNISDMSYEIRLVVKVGTPTGFGAS